MKTLLIAGTLAFVGAGAAFAQGMSAQDFVDKAASGGMFEVQSSELALDRSNDADVQAFAQKMIDDHTKANDKLAGLAKDEGLTVPTKVMGDPADHLQAVQDAEGDQFDATYLEHQVAGHEATVELFETYAGSGDDTALVTFAKDTLPTLQAHLDMAKDLEGN